MGPLGKAACPKEPCGADINGDPRPRGPVAFPGREHGQVSLTLRRSQVRFKDQQPGHHLGTC